MFIIITITITISHHDTFILCILIQNIDWCSLLCGHMDHREGYFDWVSWKHVLYIINNIFYYTHKMETCFGTFFVYSMKVSAHNVGATIVWSSFRGVNISTNDLGTSGSSNWLSEVWILTCACTWFIQTPWELVLIC